MNLPEKLSSQGAPGDAEKDLTRIAFWLAVFTLLGVALVVWTWFGSIGIALLWSLAYSVAGFLVGFLFAFPPVIKGDRGDRAEPDKAAAVKAPAPFAYRLGINTNLEQVSDWLTKIIVGLGLVQLKQFPEYLQGLAGYTAQALNPQNMSVGAEHQAAALVIYFTVLGLLGGYLVTRMFFAAAFGRAAQEMLSRQEQHSISNAPSPSMDSEEPPKLEGLAATAAEKIKDVSPADARVLGIQPEALARAKLDGGDTKAAIDLYSKAIELSPDDPKLRFDYARALRAGRRSNREVIAALNEARRLKDRAPLDLKRSIYESLTFLDLYRRPPGGFTDAILHAEEYVNDPQNPESAAIWGRLACGYGQKARWMLKDPEPQPPSDGRDRKEYLDAREHALRAATEAIRLDQKWQRTLQRALEPTPALIAKGEDDLKVFEDDKEFRQALGLPPKP